MWIWGFSITAQVWNSACILESGQSLGQKNPLESELHSSVLSRAWEIGGRYSPCKEPNMTQLTTDFGRNKYLSVAIFSCLFNLHVVYRFPSVTHSDLVEWSSRASTWPVNLKGLVCSFTGILTPKRNGRSTLGKLAFVVVVSSWREDLQWFIRSLSVITIFFLIICLCSFDSPLVVMCY